MTPGERARQRLLALAYKFEGPLRDAFQRAVSSLTPEQLAPIVKLLERGDVDGVIDTLFTQPDAVQQLHSIRQRYAEALTGLSRSIGRDLALTMHVQTKVLSKGLVDALRAWEDDAFRKIAADLRAGLRESMVAELAKGIGPRQIAVALKSPISASGLTAYDVRIIESFRNSLADGRYGDALGRSLRDRRFDATIKGLLKRNANLSPEQIDKMVAAYRRKLVAWRAETFSRTAAVQAANDAQRDVWEQQIDAGTLTLDEVRRFWIVAEDERLCKACAPIPELNPDGVGLREPFRTSDGFVDGPQLHPNCRCTVWYRRVRTGVRQRPAPGNVLLLT